MSRGKRAGASSALGAGFVAFRRALKSETIPPKDDLIALWDELLAVRLDTFVFQVFTKQRDGITNRPAYGAWLLLHGLAVNAMAGSDAGRRNGELAIGVGINHLRLAKNWLHVRDELAKFAELALRELKERTAREARLQGESAVSAPKPVKRDAKTEARDKWIYEQCCAGTPHDKIVAELKRRASAKGWRIITTKNRAWQIGKEYAKRRGLAPPPSRQNL